MESAKEIKNVDDGGASPIRSTIEFPYVDLDNAIEVVKGVHAAGGTACDADQLAAQLSMEAKGGGFRLKVLGAKIFGLVTYERGGRITLTELGMRINDPLEEKGARVEAFLAVELYQKVYDHFRGGPIPPQAGFERTLVTLGVGQKVKDKARQVLQRSAKQAGFFDLKPDRLTKPAIRTEIPTTENDRKERPKESASDGNDGGSGGGKYHPFITGLLQSLPPTGSEWSTADRANWLSIANGVFKMLYKGSTDEIEIRINQ
jgi:hypothetical protein